MILAAATNMPALTKSPTMIPVLPETILCQTAFFQATRLNAAIILQQYVPQIQAIAREQAEEELDASYFGQYQNLIQERLQSGTIAKTKVNFGVCPERLYKKLFATRPGRLRYGKQRNLRNNVQFVDKMEYRVFKRGDRVPKLRTTNWMCKYYTHVRESGERIEVKVRIERIRFAYNPVSKILQATMRFMVFRNNGTVEKKDWYNTA